MKFYVTINDGQTHELDLPVSDELTWDAFVNLKQVKALGLPVTDITPETVLTKQVEQETPEDIDLAEDL